MHDLRDVGGTPGGLGHFILGLALSATGIYLVFDRITVTSGFWSFMGNAGSSFGVTLIPVLIGVGVLFYDGRSIIGWVLSVGGTGAIVVGVIANLQIYFRATSLASTLIMFGLVAAGLGLIVRATRAVRPRSRR